ncbi:hypothetical protein [Nonomuraea sp. NPDC005650]|uniref:hypothetical protein n=1 Tax=Nonomuraea sp. NPDC005650 TaxID=3157045 RepID=UPI00339E77AC
MTALAWIGLGANGALATAGAQVAATPAVAVLDVPVLGSLAEAEAGTLTSWTARRPCAPPSAT